jgi:hypothetical protein
VRRRDGLEIVTYRRSRVYLDRDAWEMLPNDGVLLMRVQTASGQSFALAMGGDELTAVFGSVRTTKSWASARCYHFPTVPPAASAFRINTDGVPSLGGESSGSPRAGVTAARRLHPGTKQSAGSSALSGPSSLSAWAGSWFSELGVRGESDEYLAAVAAWREAWRPARVKVLLVAESHVTETDRDALIRVRSPRWVKRELPEKYVRLVYCLGYGESSLCSPRPLANGGTWQFWNLLGQLGLGSWARMPRASAGPEARLRWKVDVLNGLAKRGIWLQDASPIGLYAPGGHRLANGPNYDRLIREGYEQFVWPSVRDDQPQHIWVIGRGVGKALAGLPGIDPERVISQPQDRNQSRYRTGFRKMQTAIEDLHANPHT